MIALNARTLNAPDATPQAAQHPGSAQSIVSSDSAAQDFSALLTELVGPGPTNQITPANPNLAALSQNTIQVAGAQNTPQLPGPSASDAASTAQDANTQKVLQTCIPGQLKKQAPPDSKKTDASPKAADASLPNQIVVLPFAPVAVAASVVNDQKPLNPKDGPPPAEKLVDPSNTLSPANQPQTVMPQSVTPEMQRAWADVKKFEFTVQTDAQRGATPQVQQQAAQADPQKEAIVATTDPIANIQLQQLPPRITAIEKLVLEGKLADRAKPGTEKEFSDTSTTAPAFHFTDVTKGIEQVEQVRPAQPVDIPQTPHLPVVRTIAMEVGDADSQVTVRIQERGGDISLQISAATEPLHQDLQSSVGSLVHALRQEQIQVSNVDVSRKSPIEKVRRMKEAHS